MSDMNNKEEKIKKDRAEYLIEKYASQKNEINDLPFSVDESSSEMLRRFTSSGVNPPLKTSKKGKGENLGIILFFLFILAVGVFVWGLATHNHFIDNAFSAVYGGIYLIGMYGIIIGLLVGAGYLTYLLVRGGLINVLIVFVKIKSRFTANNSHYFLFTEKRVVQMKIAVVCNIILLLLCLASMPHDYYILVRLYTMVVFGIMAYSYYTHQRTGLAFIFGLLSLLFQPFLKITLEKNTWNVIDIFVAMGLCYVLLADLSKATK